MYILECLSSKGKNIRIKSGGGPVVIGRSPETGIKDLRLSKEHFEVRPCVDKGGLKITHLGQNRSVIKRKVSSMGYSTILRPEDTIELLEGQYKYRPMSNHRLHLMAHPSGKRCRGCPEEVC